MNFERIEQELRFGTSRSSGPGGQHANKVETRVSLWFDIAASEGLSDHEKDTLLSALQTRVNREGCLQLTCQETRSQQENKQRVIVRLRELLTETLRPVKPRLFRVRPSAGQRAARRKDKSHRSDLKASRQKIQV